MATRELTRTFVKLRADAKSKSVRRRDIVSPSEGKALMKDEDIRDWEAARHALPPVWVECVEEVNRDIAKIGEKVEELAKQHTKRLMIRFDDSENQQERLIDSTTREITGLFRKAEKVLQRLANTQLQNGTNSDAKMRQNVQRALATQLQSLSLEFRKSQKDYLSRVKKQTQGPSEFDFLSQNSSSKLQSVYDPGFTQSQMREVEDASEVINERDQEIAKIAESIDELATIFKELAVLVIDQGTILDRIDYNMEQVVERTEKGLRELKHAEKSQKSSRPMKCVAILLTMIVLMTIILILKHIH